MIPGTATAQPEFQGSQPLSIFQEQNINFSFDRIQNADSNFIVPTHKRETNQTRKKKW